MSEDFDQVSLFNVGFFSSQSSVDSYDLLEGSTADLLNARVAGEIVSLVLIGYQGHDWHGHIQIQQEMAEFFNICLFCTNISMDVSVHVLRTASSLTLSLFSPYWIINKTSRVLQYKAENVSVKHPVDFRDIVLFSFRKKNLFSKSKVGKDSCRCPNSLFLSNNFIKLKTQTARTVMFVKTDICKP